MLKPRKETLKNVWNMFRVLLLTLNIFHTFFNVSIVTFKHVKICKKKLFWNLSDRKTKWQRKFWTNIRLIFFNQIPDKKKQIYLKNDIAISSDQNISHAFSNAFLRDFFWLNFQENWRKEKFWTTLCIRNWSSRESNSWFYK